MKRNRVKNFLFITFLIAVTGAAMAYSSNKGKILFPDRNPGSPPHHSANDGVVSLSGQLIQDKVLQGSEGIVGLSLTLRADEEIGTDTGKTRHVDMVIVLDRSGSMNGRKISDAREAVLKLISSLAENDRFALVTYSDGVQIASDLLNVTEDNRERLISVVQNVRAGGGTNLGSGLKVGINLLMSATRNTNAGKVILISDGLANKGITDARSLGRIASIAVEKEFSISTVGVGTDFNEHLMTTIADQGTGNYYYLENPAAFADVFQKEFFYTQTATVTNVAVQIPLKDGISVADASGYPIKIRNGHAVFYPGNLRAGQTRKLFLTLQVPTDNEKTFALANINVRYRHNGSDFETTLDESFKIACVNDRGKVFSSIDKAKWTDKVLNDDYNRLKEEVAADIKAGKKQNALDRIEKYYGEQEAVNAVIASPRVAENLDEELKELRTVVEDSFHGTPEAVQQKQKSNAKALQYEGYSGRRN